MITILFILRGVEEKSKIKTEGRTDEEVNLCYSNHLIKRLH